MFVGLCIVNERRTMGYNFEILYHRAVDLCANDVLDINYNASKSFELRAN